MNHRNDLWPVGVQEFAPALQRRDISLLKRHLPVGPPSVMYKRPSMAWQPKHHLQQFLPLGADGLLLFPCVRPG